MLLVLRLHAIDMPTDRIDVRAATRFGGKQLIQGAVEVLEISKMQEIVTMLANLRDAALQLPEGAERQNALREIRDFQLRLAAFVRRLCSTA